MKKRGLRPIWHRFELRIWVLMMELMKFRANGWSSIFIWFSSSRANSETRWIRIVNLRPKKGVLVSKLIFSSTGVVEKILSPTQT